MAGKYLVKAGNCVGYAEFIEGGMKLNKKMRFTPGRRVGAIPRIVHSAALIFDREQVPSYTQIAGVDNIG